MKLHRYDISKYNFVRLLEDIFDNVTDLSRIHEQWTRAKSYDILDDISKDQFTVYHENFYDKAESHGFLEMYYDFVNTIVSPLFEEDILIQSMPTFRVHQPGNLAVAAFHKDADYSHSEDEVNFYLPLTIAVGNGTIWAETSPNTQKFKPIEGDVGDMWEWNGANLLHGNKINDTGKSRVSIDFRVLPRSKYIDNNMISTSNRTKMIIGDYWI